MSNNLDLFPDELMPIQPVANKKPAIKKSKQAYRTISEAADELGVATHVLRFWETKFKAVSPLKRSGGRRYYRPEDVDTLKQIRNLLYDEGYTIKGVQAYLKRGGASDIVETSLPNSGSDSSIIRNTLEELNEIRQILKNA